VTLLALAALGCSGTDGLDGEPLGEEASAIWYEGHDYIFYMTPKTWQEAKSICARGGRHLASPSRGAENNFVKAQVVQHGGGTWWIGYTDQVQENFWKWEGGSPVLEVQWASGEPNNWNNEDCATIDGSGLWNDLACTATRNFVCERDGEAFDPTSTVAYNQNDTNSAQRNYRQFAVDLAQGQGVTAETCLPPGTAQGDSFIRFLNPNSVELALNDDSCYGLLSNLSYVAPAAGQYIVRVGCYDDTACSGWLSITRE
jgi:hypothetical protein